MTAVGLILVSVVVALQGSSPCAYSTCTPFQERADPSPAGCWTASTARQPVKATINREALLAACRLAGACFPNAPSDPPRSTSSFGRCRAVERRAPSDPRHLWSFRCPCIPNTLARRCSPPDPPWESCEQPRPKWCPWKTAPRAWCCTGRCSLSSERPLHFPSRRTSLFPNRICCSKPKSCIARSARRFLLPDRPVGASGWTASSSRSNRAVFAW